MKNSKSKIFDKLVDGFLVSLPFLLSSLAIIFIPTNMNFVKMLIFILFACTLFLLIRMLMRGSIEKRKLGSIILIGGFLTWYAYPAFINFYIYDLQNDPEIYSYVNADIYLWTIFYLSLFLISGSSVHQILENRLKKENITTIELFRLTNNKFVIFFGCIGCSLGIFSYLFFESVLADLISDILLSRDIHKPWLQSSILGDQTSALTYLTSSALVAGTSLLWIALIDKNIKVFSRIILGIPTIMLTAVIYLDNGTRSIFILVIIPPISLKLMEMFSNSRIKGYLWTIIFSVMCFLLLQIQVLYRTKETRYLMGEMLFENWMTLGGSIDFFKETVFSVLLIPEYHDHFMESVIIQFLVSPIPRFIWAEKPASEMIWFYTLFRSNTDIYISGGNTLPGIVGQFYMSWGWVGPIIIGGIIGFITKGIEGFLLRPGLEKDVYLSALGVLLIVWVFISFRLMSPGFFYPIILFGFSIYLSRKIDMALLKRL